jgi:hypothetical protein
MTTLELIRLFRQRKAGESEVATMAKLRGKWPTGEEFARLGPRDQHEVLWRAGRRMELRTQRMLGMLQAMREVHGEAKVRELAADPDPQYDGLRGFLEIEQEQQEKKLRN